MTNPTSVPIVSPRMQQLQAEQEAGRARVAHHAGERARQAAERDAQAAERDAQAAERNDFEAAAKDAAKDAAKEAIKVPLKPTKAKPADDEPL